MGLAIPCKVDNGPPRPDEYKPCRVNCSTSTSTQIYYLIGQFLLNKRLANKDPPVLMLFLPRILMVYILAPSSSPLPLLRTEGDKVSFYFREKNKGGRKIA